MNNNSILQKKLTSTESTKEKKFIKLNQTQTKIRELVFQGKNVFFTGSAGTGKSFLLKVIIGDLTKKYEHLKGKGYFAVTSTTGTNIDIIGGATIHSWSGVRVYYDLPIDMLLKTAVGDEAKRRWQKVRVLLIDEISMMSGEFFDKLEEVARVLRDSDEPFGGIQLILSGDFCQLPPIEQEKDKECKYAFEAESWKECIPHEIELTEVYRQAEDPQYLELLQDFRRGWVSSDNVRKMIELEREVEITDGVKPIELFGTRSEVEEANRLEIRKVKGESFFFRAEDYEKKMGWIRHLLANTLAQEMLELKIGVQVMLIKNLKDLGLYNGKKGIVIGFNKRESNCPIVRFIDLNGKATEHTILPVWWHREVEMSGRREKIAGRRQIPLVLAWAMTIHKSQGQSIERLKLDCDRIFAVGHIYVALSRCPSSKYLQVINFHVGKVMFDLRVRRYYLNLKRIREGKEPIKELPVSEWEVNYKT